MLKYKNYPYGIGVDAELMCDLEEEICLNQHLNDVQFRKLKGFKIWRKIPSLHQDRRYEAMKTSYVVKGRIIVIPCAVGSIPEKWVDATAEGPYVRYMDFDVSEYLTIGGRYGRIRVRKLR